MQDFPVFFFIVAAPVAWYLVKFLRLLNRLLEKKLKSLE